MKSNIFKVLTKAVISSALLFSVTAGSAAAAVTETNVSYSNHIDKMDVDSSGRLFYYHCEEYPMNNDAYKITLEKNYVEGDKTTEKTEISMSGKKGSIDETAGNYIWNDKVKNGVFYMHQYKKKKYLVYDDSSGKNVFKINVRKLGAEKNKPNKKEMNIVKAARVKDKAVILGYCEKGYDSKSFCICVEYDINKKKIDKLNKFSISKADYRGLNFDNRYIYSVKRTGKVYKNKAGKIIDTRKRKVNVYNYSGKLLNTIDYSDYIYRYEETVPGNGHAENLDGIIYAENGVVYIPTQKGIYKCGALKNNLVKICDVDNTKLSKAYVTVADFMRVSKDKYAYLSYVDRGWASDELRIILTGQRPMKS